MYTPTEKNLKIFKYPEKKKRNTNEKVSSSSFQSNLVGSRLKDQYPVTVHVPNFDFLTGCHEFKRCEK